MEVDAQSVVFNAWHLTYFDEAFSAYMADRRLPYEKMIEAGFGDGGGGSDGRAVCSARVRSRSRSARTGCCSLPTTTGTADSRNTTPPSATSRPRPAASPRVIATRELSGDELPGALSYLGWSGCWMKLPVDVSGVRWASWGRYSSRNTRATSSRREDTSVFSNRLLMWSWTV